MPGPKVLRRDLLVCLALAAVTLAIYWRVGSAPFVAYDDPDYVTQNSQVQGGLTRAGFRWALKAECAGNWHPLTLLSHMLDCQLFGLDAGKHHWVNLAWHIANSLLLFCLLRKLTGRFRPCALAAALFAWHPLHVQSVAWIAERKDLLSVCFGLLALLAYAHYATATGAKAKISYLLALLLFALGLMCKPMLVTLPLLMLLLDAWPLKRITMVPGKRSATVPHGSLTRLIAEKIPFFLLSLASCVVTFKVQSVEGATQALKVAPLAKVANAAIAYCRYLGKFFWPSHLAVFYPYPHSFNAATVIAASTLLLIITLIALRQWSRQPYFLIGWLWFIGSLVPVIGLVQVGRQSLADRYTYLPSIGFFMALAWLLADWHERFPAGKRLLEYACAVGLAGCAIQSRRQVEYWQSSELLFQHAIDVTTGNEVMEYNLGVVLSQAQKWDEARDHLNQALSLDSTDAAAYNALGACLAAQGKNADALGYYVQAGILNPDSFETHLNLALSLEKLGKTADAFKEYSTATTLRPGNPAGHFALGRFLLGQGRATEALAEFRKASQLQPLDSTAHAALASALETLGQTDAAIQEFQAALKLNSSDYAALNNLAWIRAANARAEFRSGAEAVRLAQRACQLSGFTRPELIGTLAAAYAEAGDFPQAIATAKKTIDLATRNGQPGLAATNQTLLQLYQSGRPFHENAKGD